MIRERNFVMVVAVIVTAVSEFVYELRYCRYLLFALFLLYVPGIKVSISKLNPVFPFLIIIPFAILSTLNSQVLTVNYNNIYILLSVIIIFVVSTRCDISVDVFSFISVAFFFLAMPWLWGGEGFSILQSSSPFESVWSFVFGLFCVFYIGKSKPKALLFFLLTLLSLKRSAVLGIGVVCILLCMPVRLREWFLNPVFLVLSNVVMLISIVWFVSNVGLEDANLFGISLNHLTFGRYNITQAVAKDLYLDPLSFFFMGNGALSGMAKVGEVVGQEYLLHNDMLKIVYEFGFLAFILFLFSFYNICLKRSWQLTIYLTVLFWFDNTLFYFSVLFCFFLLMGYSGDCRYNSFVRRGPFFMYYNPRKKADY